MNRTPAKDATSTPKAELGAVQQRVFRPALSFAILFALICLNLNASSLYWAATASNQPGWNHNSNWTTNHAPASSTDDVYINGNNGATVTNSAVTKPYTIRSLTVGSGFGVTVGSGGNLTINTSVSNTGGAITVAGGTLNLAGTVANTGTISQTSGTLNVGTSGTSRATINGGSLGGTVTNTYGTLSGTTLLSGSTINGGVLTGTTIANGARVSGAANDSNGIFNAASGANLWINGSNAGMMNVAGPTATLTITGSVTNTGTIRQTSGTLNVGSSSTAGTISGGSVGGIVTNAYGTLSGATLLSGATVTGGTLAGVTLANGASVNGAANSGSFYANSGANFWSGGSNSGLLTGDSGSLSINGPFNNTGTVANATLTGSIGNASGTLDTVALNGASVLGGALVNTNTAIGTNALFGTNISGTLNINGGSTTISGSNGPTGTINVGSGAALTLADGSGLTAGDLNVNGGSVTVAGSVGPLDTLTLNSGSLALDGMLDVYAAHLNGGTVTGSGSFGDGSSVYNSGVNLYIGGNGGFGSWTLANYNGTGTGALIFDVNEGGWDSLIIGSGGTLTGSILVNLGSVGSLTHIPLISGLSTSSGIVISGLTGSWVSSLAGGVLSLSLGPEQVSVPDPSTALLVGSALLGLGSLRRRYLRR